MRAGACFWITGLSAAGKTTISKNLAEYLNTKITKTILLDGDQLRDIFGKTKTSYSRDARITLGLIYSRLVANLVSQGFIVIIAVQGLYKEIHEWNRSNISNYFDIFLDVPQSELQRRDPKGIYKRFFNGDVTNVAGLDLKVDFPKKPWLHVEWNSTCTVEHTVSLLTSKIEKDLIEKNII